MKNYGRTQQVIPRTPNTNLSTWGSKFTTEIVNNRVHFLRGKPDDGCQRRPKTTAVPKRRINTRQTDLALLAVRPNIGFVSSTIAGRVLEFGVVVNLRFEVRVDFLIEFGAEAWTASDSSCQNCPRRTVANTAQERFIGYSLGSR